MEELLGSAEGSEGRWIQALTVRQTNDRQRRLVRLEVRNENREAQIPAKTRHTCLLCLLRRLKGPKSQQSFDNLVRLVRAHRCDSSPKGPLRRLGDGRRSRTNTRSQLIPYRLYASKPRPALSLRTPIVRCLMPEAGRARPGALPQSCSGRQHPSAAALASRQTLRKTAQLQPGLAAQIEMARPG